MYKLIGSLLLLCVSLSATDEFVCHEMMAHVPLFAHGKAENVLIIGGGDGGLLREVLRHETVERVVIVEVDPSQPHIAMLSQGAFDDPRVEIVITKGAEYVAHCKDKFDLILCNSTDAEGPGALLFSSEFFHNCYSLLDKKGIFVNQCGVPFIQKAELVETYAKLKEIFKDVRFFLAPIPSSVGGFMAFGFASPSKDYRDFSKKQVKKELKKMEGECEYYTPKIHKAAFVLPKFIENAIEKSPSYNPD
jgi:spermidine synthase